MCMQEIRKRNISMKNKNVLITGGEGFLGQYLVDYLLQKGGFEVVIFDKLPHQMRHDHHGRVFSFNGDILSKEDVRKVFKIYGPFSSIYHLAGAMPDKSFSDDLTWKTNVLGTINLVTRAIYDGTRSFIFTSSNVTYGVPESLPVTEETPLRPLEIYGKSKAQAEKELEEFKNYINIQIFRCPVITGVGRLGLQAILFEFISENRNVYVLGDGSNRYQFVDAQDVCVALEMASHKKGFEVYNIGADNVLSLRQLYEHVISAAKSRSKIISLPKWPAMTLLSVLDKLNISPLGIYQYTMIGRSMYADTTKIKKTLGWRPKKTNLQSFLENYAWYIKNRNTFTEIGKGTMSSNRSLPKMKVFKLLKMLS